MIGMVTSNLLPQELHRTLQKSRCNWIFSAIPNRTMFIPLSGKVGNSHFHCVDFGAEINIMRPQ
jgi:hypothetical protein